MIFVLGSALTLAASFFVFLQTKKGKHAIRTALYDLMYNVLAVKEILYDYMFIYQNKTDLPNMTGKVAIVTGGSRGIGTVVVKMLLQCEADVIIACRNEAAGEKLVKEIRDSGVTTGSTRVLSLDNSSFDSTRNFVAEVKKYYDKVDVLINNAGIMFSPYNETKDGFEAQWEVNYLSHFLLTSLLMPLLKAAGKKDEYARIVNVSSCAHLLGSIDFDDINQKKNFVTSIAYAQSKLAQTMFTKTLQEQFIERKLNITTTSVHPGVVNTDLFDTTWLKHVRWVIRWLFKTSAQGAVPIVFAAVNKSVQNNSMVYINNCVEFPVNPLVYDTAIRKRLFELSLKQVQVKDFFEGR